MPVGRTWSSLNVTSGELTSHLFNHFIHWMISKVIYQVNGQRIPQSRVGLTCLEDFVHQKCLRAHMEGLREYRQRQTVKAEMVLTCSGRKYQATVRPNRCELSLQKSAGRLL